MSQQCSVLLLCLLYTTSHGTTISSTAVSEDETVAMKEKTKFCGMDVVQVFKV